MRQGSKLNSILDQLNHPDLDNILLAVEQSHPLQAPTRTEVQTILFQSFLDECERFLSQEHKFHQFSKKIGTRCTDIIGQIDKIERYNKVGANAEVESEIKRILNKTQLNAGRDECLSKILDHLQVPDAMIKKIVDPGQPVDLAFFQAVASLDKLKLLFVTLQTFGNNKLMQLIKKNHGALMASAVSKTIKNLGALSEVTDIEILKKYKEILAQPQENRRKFEESIISARRQVSQNYFLPILSQLNYSLKKPIEEYYSDIFSEILQRFQQERVFLNGLFPESRAQLLSQLMTAFVPEVYSRLQRCFFKGLTPLSMAKVKSEYIKYYQRLRLMLGTQEYKSVHIEASLAKLDQLITSTIKIQAEQMMKSKYNIYSVAGYVSIAQKLKTLHQAYLTDSHDPRWVEPFFRLVESRLPTQTNKSLVIFAVNIWQVYKKVFGAQKDLQFQGVTMLTRAQEMIDKSCRMFQEMNRKDFLDKTLHGIEVIQSDQLKAIEQLLSICSSDPKKTLHSELSLIIHEDIRNRVKSSLNQFLMEKYARLLSIVPPCTNDQLKALCLQKGINIKTLGRAADTVCIYSTLDMRSLIE